MTTPTHQEFRAAFVDAHRGQKPGYSLTRHPDPKDSSSIAYVAFLSVASTGNPATDQELAPKIEAAIDAWTQSGQAPSRKFVAELN